MHDGDLREQILDLEARIEKLAEEIESCRKIILISKAFTAVGGILIVAMTIGIVRFDPTIMIGALAAVIGGIVFLGSNWSTLQQALAALKAAETIMAPPAMIKPMPMAVKATVGIKTMPRMIRQVPDMTQFRSLFEGVMEGGVLISRF